MFPLVAVCIFYEHLLSADISLSEYFMWALYSGQD